MVLEKLKKEMYGLLTQKIDVSFGIKYTDFTITKNQKEGYGDFTSTVAFSLSKVLKRPPIEIAEKLTVEEITTQSLKLRIEAVAPGFLNIYLLQDWRLMLVEGIQRGNFKAEQLHDLLNTSGEDCSVLKNKMEYIVFRTKWVLEVLEGEGIEADMYLSRGNYTPTCLEMALVDGMVSLLELQEPAVLQQMVETFERYQNAIVLRKLEGHYRSFVLGLFLAINNLFSYLIG
ncbi:hypothetical protein [Alkaliphilus hydrothermalis]|uniref:Arginyl tRNA synthetase N-terminal domain-containing protein n=1 Tax=Alkaliphilus hydrothermalis TaxID=1482730 RepID=A0ABS2NSM9_9FIRM|nr:hypothetical protein [Alkaliphilus hydrothermalis]MBM7615955.1 hypothetical protein [Alkaliphilus hydrothermalis]